MPRLVRLFAAALLTVIAVPAVASAQGTITGVVTDASGAVLPGVTVEAASPALIEQVRTVVTDGTGQYRIVDLRPGAYTVTFTLPGFRAVKQDGVGITGTFVATVNGVLTVGSLEETVTVTGASTTVDLQSVKVQQTMSKEVLAVIPTARTAQALQALVPGMVPTRGIDPGGASGSFGGDTGALHGGRATDSRTMNDGLTTNNAGGNSGLGNNANVAGAEEVVVTTSGGLGEAETSGVVFNLIPREGGNEFSGTLFLNGANGRMQGSNYTQDLKDRGLRAPARILKVYDINPMVGGPLLRNRLWFYFTERAWGADNTVPGMFINRNAGNPEAWTYEPDLSRPAFVDVVNKTHILRLTWQATRRNKFAFYWSEQYNCLSCRGGGTATQTTEATLNNEFKPSRVQQVTWSSPLSSRVLLEAGFGSWTARFGNGYLGGRQDGTHDPRMIRVVEQGGAIPGLAYRAPAQFLRNAIATRTWRASVSYVPGSHNMKFGYFGGFTNPVDPGLYFYNEIVAYQFNNGVPNQLTQSALFPKTTNYQRNLIPTSLFAQDQWTRGRLTLQGGLRYDYLLTNFPEQRVGGTALIPTEIVFPSRSTPGTAWHDLTARMGAAYDLFGDATTAVKIHLGKYPEGFVIGAGQSMDLNPIARVATQTTRAWNDADRDFVPDCVLSDPLANGECGAMANQNLGKNLFSRTVDSAWSTGWGSRPYNWEFSVALDRQLAPHVTATAAFVRRWFGNWYVVDNRATTVADYTPFTIVAPTDSRLPGGGGQTVGTLYDLVPGKVGQIDELAQAAGNFGDQTENWQGFDLSISARMANGLFIRGGTSTGRRLSDTCEVRGNLPELGATIPTDPSKPVTINAVSPTSPYCRVVEPLRTHASGLVSYRIPMIGVQVSATLQSTPGPELAASYVVPNATVRQTLGRDLSGNAANITVNLVEPGTLYGDRINQVDFRIAKLLTFGRVRTQLAADVYNITNADTPLTYNPSFRPGGAWLTPTSVLAARFVKLGLQVDF